MATKSPGGGGGFFLRATAGIAQGLITFSAGCLLATEQVGLGGIVYGKEAGLEYPACMRWRPSFASNSANEGDGRKQSPLATSSNTEKMHPRNRL